jgi:hypothetical protein
MALRTNAQVRRRRVTATLAAITVAASVVASACAPNSTDPTSVSRPDESVESPVVDPPVEPPVTIEPVPDDGPPVAPAPTDPLHEQVAPWVTAGVRPGIGGCALFPADHVYRASVGTLPVHPNSDRMIAATGGRGLPLRGGFSSGIWMGSRAGIPFNVVDGSTTRRIDFSVTYDYDGSGPELLVPVPPNPKFEGWPGKAWDMHLVVVDTSTCQSREIIGVRTPGDDFLGIGGGRWYADAAAIIDLTSNAPSFGAATASRISLLAGLVQFGEVEAGHIGHAISATLDQIKAAEFLWPAMSSDGRSSHPDALPMGSWLRLRSDVDLSGLGPQARVVAEALRTHGMIVTDTGPDLALQGEPDLRWDDDDIRTLRTLELADFEVLDASGLMVSPRSFQMRTS